MYSAGLSVTNKPRGKPGRGREGPAFLTITTVDKDLYLSCLEVCSPYARWRCLSTSQKRLSSSAPPDCHRACPSDCLVGLVVRHPPRERKILGLNPACARIFSKLSHTSDSKIGTPVATLSGAWRYRVSAGTGWSGVSIL